MKTKQKLDNNILEKFEGLGHQKQLVYSPLLVNRIVIVKKRTKPG